MNNLGKYVRHFIAAVFGLVFALLVTWLDLPFDAEQADTLAGQIATLLEPFAMLVGYAFVEKYLKRFRSLDLQGWIDRLWLKREAKEMEVINGDA